MAYRLRLWLMAKIDKVEKKRKGSGRK